ncbi:TetR/AcrR family transcriptional regulator [Cellulomonas fengjieae]|uniref:TetR family transcriptional regulator n=1 Tax=Cellulomonas fengjieae TaxID=2819978 RepID=A0ABS3SGY7_9CELL|nr:TetR family transcriptional regulator [Cellulomonas fengjieae]MBO3085008.1 TetR family transcriptional regulator [Cellulomonas fengjieae]MBO3100755.1 TetR family transcriptional regulator [Cellulomonas fengjieae]QVI66395.1 TetR family transcriptional regulator [Cellulomonas fengjieae]
MNRLPVAERREQLIEAALAVASRDGIDAATVRAIAAEAGVSLGVVHYCFQDKDELLRAMAHAITTANLERSLGEALAEAQTAESVIERALDALWTGIRESRGPQLLSYELTTSSLRHPELNQVAIEQYRGQWAAAEHVLELVERSAQVSWSVPRGALARTVVAMIDGYSLAWLVDGDSEAALSGLQRIGRYLATVTVPAPVADTAATPA